MSTPMMCQYCGQPAKWVQNSGCVYSKDYGPIWLCMPCKAWVGCHRGTRVPKGSLANKELRNARISAHDNFDKIWKYGVLSRKDAYGWLAEAMGMTREQCHIGMFDLEQCRRVSQLCRARIRPQVQEAQ